MSILGIDIGTSYSVLSTVGRGVVTIVRNDLSERLTPSLVAFSPKERLVGDAALALIKSNYKNTCRNIKQLLGKSIPHDSESASDLELADLNIERQYSTAPLDVSVTEGRLVGYRVSYLGEECIFTATRCLAALLVKLKLIGENAIGGPVKDVVIGVPGWLTESARQAVLDAAELAGLSCLRVMNEHAAVALDYGIYRSSTFDEKAPFRVAFVGIGHGTTSISVAEFIRGQLKILGTVSDKTLGGRNFIHLICERFAEAFDKRTGLNAMEDMKARLKLEETAAKAMKMVSANAEAPFNIECLIGDEDINGSLTRADFEELCAPFRLRLTEAMQSVFTNNNIAPDSIQALEIVGGCTRIPWVQETISSCFDHRLPISKTLNMDESVARGCGLQAAMLNPRYRVRDFNVIDTTMEKVSLSWTSQDGSGEIKSTVLFDRGSPLGTSKWLTFDRASPFEIFLQMGSGAPSIHRVDLTPRPDGSQQKVKVKVRLTIHGTVNVEAAQIITEEEVEEVVEEKRPITAAPGAEEASATAEDVPMEGATGTPAATTGAQQQYETVKVTKKKVHTKKVECPVVSSEERVGFISATVKSILADKEVTMAMTDRRVKDAQDIYNELEAFIYDMRNKLSASLVDFVKPEDKEALSAELTTIEDWLYDNPPTDSKTAYVEKLDSLKKQSDPIERRLREFEGQKEAFNRLRQTLSEVAAGVRSPQFVDCVPADQMDQLVQKSNEVEAWMSKVLTEADSRSLAEDPPITTADVNQQIETLQNLMKKTLVVPPPPSMPPAKGAASASDTSMNSNNVTASQNSTNSGGDVPSAPAPDP